MSSVLGVALPPHLYGVAVNGLAAATHIHHLGDFQDIVWHVAAGTVAVAHLPPLLPVIQDLSEHSISLMNPSHCGPKQLGTYLHHLVLQHRQLCVVSCYKVVPGRSKELRLATAGDEAPGQSRSLINVGKKEGQIHSKNPPTSADKEGERPHTRGPIRSEDVWGHSVE